MKPYIKGIVFLFFIAILISFLRTAEGFQAAAQLPTTIKCTSQAITADNVRWLCNSETDAKKLINHATETDRTFLKENDQICYTYGDVATGEDEGKMQLTYMCYDKHKPSFKESDYEVDPYPLVVLDTYDSICNNIRTSDMDLSGAVDVTNSMTTLVDDSLTKVNTELSRLNALYTNMKCEGLTSPANVVAMCAGIRTGLDTIKAERDNINKYKSTIEGPLDDLRGSRTTVSDFAAKFKCKI